MADSAGVAQAADSAAQLHSHVKELLEALEQKKLSMDAMAMVRTETSRKRSKPRIEWGSGFICDTAGSHIN